MEIRHGRPGRPSQRLHWPAASHGGQTTKDAAFTRRLLALAEIYDGGSRSNAGRIGGVGLQMIRDWVLRFNAKGPDGLKVGKAPGQPSRLKDEHRRALIQMVGNQIRT